MRRARALAACVCLLAGTARAEGPAGAPGSEPVAEDETGASDAPATKAVPRAPARPPVCTDDKLRLVGAVAAPVNAYALVRGPEGTALLSRGERLHGHELLRVGTYQALLRAPDGEPCRLLFFHRSDADKVVKRKKRRRRKRRRRKRRRR